MRRGDSRSTSKESDLSLYCPLGQGGSRDAIFLGSNTRRYVKLELSINGFWVNEKEERNGNVKKYHFCLLFIARHSRFLSSLLIPILSILYGKRKISRRFTVHSFELTGQLDLTREIE